MIPIFGQGKVDANGNVTITMPVPPPGTTWTGPINVPATNPSARWTIQYNSSGVGGMNGASSYGPIQCTGQDTIVLIGAGVTPNTTAVAVWNIVQHLDYEAPDVPPAATAIAVSTTRPALLIDAQINQLAGTYVKTYTIDPNCRAISMMFARTGGPQSPFTSLTIVGGTTTFIYVAGISPSQGGTGGANTRPAVNLFQINGAIEQSITVTVIIIGGGSGSWWIAEEFDPLIIAIESIADTANVVIEEVQKTPQNIARVALATLTAVNFGSALTAGRGFEIQAPYASAVDANGVAMKVVCGAGPASATLGKEFPPGGVYARNDYNPALGISVFNPSAVTLNIEGTSWA